MTGWKEKSLSDVLADVRPGFAFGGDLPGGVFQIRMNNITNDGHLDLAKKRRVQIPCRNPDDLLVAPGDVLFNATNSPDLVGKSAYFPGLNEPTTFSNHFLRLRPKHDQLDGQYLARWLTRQFQRGLFKGMCRQWVNQATVNRDSLLALRFPFPPLLEQRRIADLLNKVDKQRTKRRNALGLTDELLRSIFLDMFGDPITNPKGWERKPLGTLGILARGKSKHRPRNDPSLLGGPYPLIQTGEVASAETYIRAYSQTYSELGLQQSKMWPKGTLCITIAANIADTAILGFDACFPDSVVGFTPGEETTTEYIHFWLRSYQRILQDMAPESAQKNINLEILDGLMVGCPPIERQKNFVQAFSYVEALKTQLREGASTADNLFLSLQQRAFRQ